MKYLKKIEEIDSKEQNSSISEEDKAERKEERREYIQWVRMEETKLEIEVENLMETQSFSIKWII